VKRWNRVRVALVVLVVGTLCGLWSAVALGQSCSVSASGVSFAGYDPFALSDVLASGQIEVRCSEGTAYEVRLSPGEHGSLLQRKLKHLSLSWTLSYQLFTDAARTVIWGDGSGSSGWVSGVGQGTSAPQVHVIYGRLPARQNVHVGDYQDQIVVTVNY